MQATASLSAGVASDENNLQRSQGEEDGDDRDNDSTTSFDLRVQNEDFTYAGEGPTSRALLPTRGLDDSLFMSSIQEEYGVDVPAMTRAELAAAATIRWSQCNLVLDGDYSDDDEEKAPDWRRRYVTSTTTTAPERSISSAWHCGEDDDGIGLHDLEPQDKDDKVGVVAACSNRSARTACAISICSR